MKKMRKKLTFSRIVVYCATLITVLVLLFIVAYILIKGVPHISLDLFAWEYNSENVSLMPALINTILMTILSLLIAVPLSVFAAIYLVEYARRGNKFVKIIRMTTENAERDSIHRLRTLRAAVFCIDDGAWVIAACGCDDTFDHDPAADHAHHRGGADRSP